MKVTVYETLRDMKYNEKGFVIEPVTRINESKASGWSITKEDNALVFCVPSNMFVKIEN